MKPINLLFIFALLFVIFSCTPQPGGVNDEVALHDLNKYRTELDSFRHLTTDPYKLPNIHFFQFGMGNRTKILYKNGILLNSRTGDTLEKWDVKSEVIIPYNYMVYLKTKQNDVLLIKEDSAGVWIFDKSKKRSISGTSAKVTLPNFENFRYPTIMKVLHHEILINIVDGKPLPNLFAYNNPWRRDGAMVAMCLKATGNLDQIKSWVLSITDPFDRNNAGESEADNLGQTLYLLSLFVDKSNPMVNKILEEAKKYEFTDSKGIYIKGRSDFHETPVYQTKWMKFGLKQFALPDKYTIPKMKDNYSSLFWWDYKSHYVAGTEDANDKKFYPYLGWASDHFHGNLTSPISDRDYPLTWEIQASQANYAGMSKIDTTYTSQKIATPHTWHSAEIFLYLLEKKRIKYSMTNKYL